MTDSSLKLADLLAECDAHVIRLMLASDGGLEIEGPQDALTPDLLARLKAHKDELLTMLRPVPVLSVVTIDATAKPVCRCGSTNLREVPIHKGQSIRRDCGRCGRFFNFPVWYGKNDNPQDRHQNEQPSVGVNFRVAGEGKKND